MMSVFRQLEGLQRLICAAFMLSVCVTSLNANTIGPPLRTTATVPVANDVDRVRATQLRETLLVKLINSRMFEVAPSEQLIVAARNHNESSEIQTPEEIIARVAAELGIDFLLHSAYSETPQGFLWTINLVSVTSGQAVFSESYESATFRLTPIVRRASEDLIAFATTVRVASPADIRVLIQAGHHNRALRMVDWLESLSQFRGEPVLSELRATIYENLSEEELSRARRLAEIDQFDEAIVYANRALSYVPDRTEVIVFIDSIQTLREEARQRDFGSKVSVLDGLVEEGDFISAQRLLSHIEELYPERVESLDTIRVQIARSVAAQHHYRRALSFFWDEEYENARSEIRLAILADPGNDSLGAFDRQVTATIQRQQRNEQLRDTYFSLWTEMTVDELVLTPRLPVPFLWAAIGFGEQRYRNIDDLQIVSVPQRTVSAHWHQPYILPLTFDSPWLRLGWYWSTSLGVQGGSFEQTDATGLSNKRLERTAVWQVRPGAGIGLTLHTFAITTVFGVSGHSGVMMVDTLNRDPIADIDERIVTYVFANAVHGDFGIYWMPNTRDYVTLMFDWTLWSRMDPVPIEATERYFQARVSLGYGRRFSW